MMRGWLRLLSPCLEQLTGKHKRMEAIKEQSRVTFQRNVLEGEEFNRALGVLKGLMDRLQATDVGLDETLLQEDRPAPVTYVEILDDPFFTISMFVLRPNRQLPLHDHPHMFGICKVVRGKVRVRNYSLLGDPATLLQAKVLAAAKEDDLILDEESSAVLLTPRQRNLHEISSVDGPAAFVDVLAPPYETNEGVGPRPCSYYLEVDSSGSSPGSVVRLLRTDKSGGYWTDYAPYLGP